MLGVGEDADSHAADEGRERVGELLMSFSEVLPASLMIMWRSLTLLADLRSTLPMFCSSIPILHFADLVWVATILSV